MNYLTEAQLVQLYAPLAGLLVFAFALGLLWQRVKTIERAVFKEDDILARLIKLEVQGTALSTQVSKVETQIEGVHREINELMRTQIRGKGGAATIERG